MTIVRLVGGLEYISEKDYNINHSNDIFTWTNYTKNTCRLIITTPMTISKGECTIKNGCSLNT